MVKSDLYTFCFASAFGRVVNALGAGLIIFIKGEVCKC